MIGGAYTSYNIGSAFASGAEALQFFGSWGGIYPFVILLLPFLSIIIYGTVYFSTGKQQNFSKPADAYQYFCGKYIGLAIDIFTLVIIAGMTLVMFAGAGAAINQYFGVPTYLGAVLMGVVCALVVCLGLEKLTDVLGVAGIVIVLFVLGIGIYSIVTADVGIMEAQENVLTYVENGDILQAGLFGICNPWLSALYYTGLSVLTSCPFMVALGGQIKKGGETVACSASSALMYVGGILLVLFPLLHNMDYIAQTHAQVPLLAIIQKNLPMLSFVFVIILMVGIFTTITGYLWLLSRRFAPDCTPKSRGIVAIVTIVGVIGGSLLPFSVLVNKLYPFGGLIGLVLFVGSIAKAIKLRGAASRAIPEGAEGETSEFA